MLLPGDPVGRAAARIETMFGSTADWLANDSGEALFGSRSSVRISAAWVWLPSVGDSTA